MVRRGCGRGRGVVTGRMAVIFMVLVPEKGRM